MISPRHCIPAALAIALGLPAGEDAFGAGRVKARSSWAPDLTPNRERTFVRIAGGQAVPVIHRADVLVVGSSLEGCFLAERTAREAGDAGVPA